jgi:hypothetical protein
VIQDTAVMEPATTTTGFPPPLPHVIQDTAVIEEPATTGHPPPLTHRRAGTRQPAIDHTGKPCGCGCGKKLEHKAYKSCTQCEDKETSIASNKISLSCWGKNMHCIACSDAERYNSLIAPAFFNGYKKM